MSHMNDLEKKLGAASEQFDVAQTPDCKCVFCGRVWSSKEYRRVCPMCEHSADPRVEIPDEICEFCEIDGYGNHAPRCPVQLETERDRLRAALDEIAQHDSSEFTPEHRRLIQIARKARAKGTA